ncbi:hypothetical protein Y032_0087g2020 [Ancylostoma ceylanicum]|uniref:Uncharacterized protein n=1 Tax=Ancylostoma ceylanicum TaxID=53326 RepID=A0A016TN91_9BILA|nr:hypothetical protein Y032_0087g2020 [Ancylostoma ceylanicum]
MDTESTAKVNLWRRICSCCFRKGSVKMMEEKPTQVDTDDLKVSEEQNLQSEEKPPPGSISSNEVVAQGKPKKDESRKSEEERDSKRRESRKKKSREGRKSSEEKFLKTAELPKSKKTPKDKKKHRDKRSAEAMKKKDQKKENEDSGSDVIDYWLTLPEQIPLGSRERYQPEPELPVDRTTEMVLSVIQPAPLDYSTLPPALQATFKGTAKEVPLEQLKNNQASAEKGSSAASAESTPKNLKPPDLQRQSREAAIQPFTQDAYGVADRPPSMKKPMFLQQSYGVADRPSSTDKAAYGVIDRPPSVKKPMLSQQSYGVIDRPGSGERLDDGALAGKQISQMQKLSSQQKLSSSQKASLTGKPSGLPSKQQPSLAARVEALRSAAAARKPLVDESSSSSQNRNAPGKPYQQDPYAESIRLYDLKTRPY